MGISAIENQVELLRQTCETINQLSGWSTVVLTGGPNPSLKNEKVSIQTYGFVYLCLLSRPLALISPQGFLWYNKHWEYLSRLVSSMGFGSRPTISRMVNECLRCVLLNFVAYPNVETDHIQMIPLKSRLLKVMNAPNRLQTTNTHQPSAMRPTFQHCLRRTRLLGATQSCPIPTHGSP